MESLQGENVQLISTGLLSDHAHIAKGLWCEVFHSAAGASLAIEAVFSKSAPMCMCSHLALLCNIEKQKGSTAKPQPHVVGMVCGLPSN